MKYSTKLSDALHILAFIALHPDERLTSDRIAESIRTNPGYVRQLMSSMRRCGLLVSIKGHPRPSLSKKASAVSLLDVYRSVEGEKPLLHLDTHTNPECGIGINIQLSVSDYFRQVQSCAEREMQAITLQDVLDRYEEKISGLNGNHRKSQGPSDLYSG
jgi:Rrf2 family protein